MNIEDDIALIKPILYILDKNGNPEPCDDALKWGKWMAEGSELRKIKRTELDPNTFVSTVFLGVDHSYMRGDPVLFETMVFTDKNEHLDDLTRRYYTREEALKGHNEICEEVKKTYSIL